MPRALITLPNPVRRDEVIDIRTLIAHPMETGYRPGEDGTIVPRNLIRHFECEYAGERVFSAEMFPAVAANPLLVFSVRAVASGELVFRWTGDQGFEHTERVGLVVT